MTRNGGVSFWYGGRLPDRRRPLPGDRRADVVIAGGGLTGLWTAYYLKRARPELEIVVLEREFAGFGASGRNGGWLSDHFSTPGDAMAHGEAMRASIDEVIAVCADEEIDADIVKHGVLMVARGPAQRRRLSASVAHAREWGATAVELDGEALAARIRVARAEAGAWSPDCARVQPAKLVRGLAAAVERLGVVIHESTTVQELQPGRAITDRGTVHADVVLSCLEGFTASLRGQRRAWLALNSAMIVTDPLPDAVWAEIGWAGEELLGDCAHAYSYAQRTADGRIAIGGRGVPYRFGSRTDRNGVTQRATIGQLTRLLHDAFPAVRSIPIAHAWCGVLGVGRDWASTVRFDASSGLGTAGGYVGNGLTTTNLAGRTLRDLVLGHDTPLVTLPWVGHEARRWEPEPLRWLGTRMVYGLYRAADRHERLTGRTTDSPVAVAASRLAGR